MGAFNIKKKKEIDIKHRISQSTDFDDCTDHLFYIGVSPDEIDDKILRTHIKDVMDAYETSHSKKGMAKWAYEDLPKQDPALSEKWLKMLPHHDGFIKGKICDKHRSELQILWVSPRFRNQKYATALLDTMLKESDKNCVPLHIRANPIEFKDSDVLYYGKENYSGKHTVDIDPKEYRQNLKWLVSFYKRKGFVEGENANDEFVSMTRKAACLKNNKN